MTEEEKREVCKYLFTHKRGKISDLKKKTPIDNEFLKELIMLSLEISIKKKTPIDNEFLKKFNILALPIGLSYGELIYYLKRNTDCYRLCYEEFLPNDEEEKFFLPVYFIIFIIIPIILVILMIITRIHSFAH